MFQFLGLLLIPLCCFFTKHQRHVEIQKGVREFLSSIPEEERILLDYFFRCLIQEDSIGYVLLGAKPMSTYSYIRPKVQFQSSFTAIDQLDYFFESFDVRNAIIEQGWQVWKKYAPRFCGENIVFDILTENLEFNFTKIIVINKQLIQEMINSHFQKFTALASVKDKNTFCYSLIHDPRLKEKIHSRPDLLGICLGYGAKNADLFHKMTNLHKILGHFGLTLSKPSQHRVQQAKDELEALECRFKTCSIKCTSKKHWFQIGLSFRADLTDRDTQQLQKKYSHCYKILNKPYQGANFLEKTLELIYLANE